MSRLSLIGLFITITYTAQAQKFDSIPARPQVGLEVLRMPFNAILNPGSRFVKTLICIEPTVFVVANQPDKLIVIRGGYSHFTGVASEGNISLDGQGGFLKAGKQSRRTDWVGFGWLGTFAVYQTRGTYRFAGPVFGDYVGQLQPKTNISAGIEGITEIYVKLGGRWSLAAPIRLNIAIASSPRGYAEPYIPGLGYAPALFNTSFLHGSAGVNLYLLYQL